MAKAFDPVSHSCLLSKVKSNGIIDSFHSWLASYLTSRSLPVNVAKTQPITSGLTQGSVLAPLMFTAQVTDLFSIIRHRTLYSSPTIQNFTKFSAFVL